MTVAQRLQEAIALQDWLLSCWKLTPEPRSESRKARLLEQAMFGVSNAIEALEKLRAEQAAHT
jgi:hypothetical protein